MPKILVVDDIPAIVDFSKEFFEDAGFEVRTADTATGAIKAQREFRADVILQDLNIPEGGGMHVYETLRAENDTVPIIFSTGKPETLGDITKMINVSALRKPTNPDVLMAEVQKRIADRKAPAAPAQAAPPPPPPPAPRPAADDRPMNPNPPPPPKFPR
ncbi:MAG: response regulator [Elusimicrobia bacterium]|nr:response regulator [Elusimicrobiota bacterium]